MFLKTLLLLVAFASKSSWSAYTQSNDIDYNDLGPYEYLVEATNEILPEIADVFVKISKDDTLAKDPFSPEGLLDLIQSFMPISRKVLLATAKAEGRKVTQADIDRLEKIQRDLPAAFAYIAQLRELEFPESTSSEIYSRPQPSRPSAQYPTIKPIQESLNRNVFNSQKAKHSSVKSKSPAQLSQTSAFGSRHPSTGRADAHFGTSVIAPTAHKSAPSAHSSPVPSTNSGSSHFSIPQHTPSWASTIRVHRGASASAEGEDSPISKIESKSFIKMPSGSALFIRHPLSKTNTEK